MATQNRVDDRNKSGITDYGITDYGLRDYGDSLLNHQLDCGAGRVARRSSHLAAMTPGLPHPIRLASPDAFPADAEKGRDAPHGAPGSPLPAAFARIAARYLSFSGLT